MSRMKARIVYGIVVSGDTVKFNDSPGSIKEWWYYQNHENKKGVFAKKSRSKYEVANYSFEHPIPVSIYKIADQYEEGTWCVAMKRVGREDLFGWNSFDPESLRVTQESIDGFDGFVNRYLPVHVGRKAKWLIVATGGE